jgi:hypothetical protein
MTQQDPNDFLMGGGSSNPAWKFDEPGTTRVGAVIAIKARQERDYDPKNPGQGAPKFFPSGDPIMGVLADLKTDERDPAIDGDDGKRTFYIEGRYLKEAVREAVLAAGAKGLEPGGRISVTFTHREDPYDKRSRKFWQVQYVSAAQAHLMQPSPAPTAPPVPAMPAPAPTPTPTPQAVQPTSAAAAALGNLTPEQIQQLLATQQQVGHAQPVAAGAIAPPF